VPISVAGDGEKIGSEMPPNVATLFSTSRATALLGEL